eukprot:m.54251 g.54251  ORF g.54251 m.54251 type:complete len:254 (-) comp11880_c0_seq3:107-868(-)
MSHSFVLLCFALTLCLALDGLEMAWRCHGRTNAEMVAALRRAGIIKSAEVAEAMTAVDRGHYTAREPYQDSPQPIGFAATISAPHMHAYALEILLPKLGPGSKVLDVGCGSGYLTSCFAELVAKNNSGGKVVGIEHIPSLCQSAETNINKNPRHAAMLQQGIIALVCGDGRLGYPPGAPYDVIHVGAAASPLPPALVQQLKPDGWLLSPVGDAHGDQMLRLVKKGPDGSITQEDLMGVRYVPLTSAKNQLSVE